MRVRSGLTKFSHVSRPPPDAHLESLGNLAVNKCAPAHSWRLRVWQHKETFQNRGLSWTSWVKYRIGSSISRSLRSLSFLHLAMPAGCLFVAVAGRFKLSGE